MPAGSLARVPPLVVHGFRNASDADFRYLNFHAPGSGFADYMRALRDGRKLSYDQHDRPRKALARSPRRVVERGAPIGDGVELLTDVEAIRVTRVHGATERRAYDQLVVVLRARGRARARRPASPGGFLDPGPAGLEHAVEGVYLCVMAPSSTA